MSFESTAEGPVAVDG